MLTNDERLLIEKMAESTELSTKEVEEIYSTMKNIITTVWEEMKRIINNISEIIAEYEEVQKRKDWERELNLIPSAPKNIIKHHQVMDRKPMFSHIRNSI